MSADAGGGAAAAAQYAALAKNATGAGAARLTRDACGHAGLFAFGELLEAEGIQALAGTEHAGSLELLRLFAYGTWTDYRVAAAKEGGSSLPALSDERLQRPVRVDPLAHDGDRLRHLVLLHRCRGYGRSTNAGDGTTDW